MEPSGLHHVTGVTGDVQANADFYLGLLGLRLVKRTVNHQDPSTLHLFYAPHDGSPGTALTFFAWPDTAEGRRGVGQAAEVGLSVPRAEVGFWYERLLSRGVRFGGPTAKGGQTTLSLEDPDGLPIVLVGTDDAPAPAADAERSGVPPAASVRGLHHVTLWSDQVEATGEVLTALLGFEAVDRAGTLRAYRAPAEVGSLVYVRDAAGFWPAAGGVGTVHHVAFRRDMDTFPARLREYAAKRLLAMSPLREHGYFRSAYFREPSGALFEVASDDPGLTLDEPLQSLGEALVLPPDLEPRRAELETVLPTFALPGEARLPRRDLGWVHRFVPGSSGATLVLLHGVGGDETTLLPLARRASSRAHLLSLRGHIADGAGPSFVRRSPAGQADPAALRLAADELAVFVREAARHYDLGGAPTVLVGHEDGADLALASLSRHPDAFSAAALLRPGLAPSEPPRGRLDGKRVLLVLGSDDPSLAQGEAAAAYLSTAGAEVEVVRVPLGTVLWDPDVEALRVWLDAAG